ncbi:FGGY-family carbohydrate kinase [Aphanothece sacrum]|uniref:D-ribulose kinase n=1 Tax=Aphanothece sacrum FPU1 TaxID=1920663 RepID=A0A401ICU3_APHSA|nr:FGGY-family carbohydrate kinase [Aphanothece sacrum]GBF79009.1 hypothetical protein AsFPU1_0401 [Aphanothece sacrum FPU1]GBF86112.1 hypothetical protein AsFPU3_3182 [Aphanothece sacrum FPU3]
MFYLGIDFGTSGARAIVIDENESIQTKINCTFETVNEDKLASNWQNILYTILGKIPLIICQEIRAIAINGTSSTVLLCNAQGMPIVTPLWYDDIRGKEYLKNIQEIAPDNHIVCSASSSLAKLFWWYNNVDCKEATFFLHQADWLGSLLHGKLGISDYHNALKLGYDVNKLNYPNWLTVLPFYTILPQILPPGTPVESVTLDIAEQFNLRKDCQVCTGTTDSIAAFLASGVKHPGEGVTSLGSTLVLKLLSQTSVNEFKSGIYSHRLGDLWLTGGASNTGGAVLRHFFTNKELEIYSNQIITDKPSNLDYYPLLKPGERFPINDPQLLPKINPKPDNKVKFLQGLLESMAKIEALGYQKLQELGATPLTQVYTAGGGAKNKTWQKIRERFIKVPVSISPQTEAAYGTALLAKRSHINLE